MNGSAAVEFALVLPLVLLVLLAVTQIAVVARTQLEVANAAREGARRAATAPDPASAIDAARNALDPEVADRARIQVVRPRVVGRQTQVTVVLPVRLAALGGITVEVRSRAVMRVER
jgi:Flp pilus assembly protein TadG